MHPKFLVKKMSNQTHHRVAYATEHRLRQEQPEEIVRAATDVIT